MDVLLSVDPSTGVPLHRQVYEGIRGAILAGRLQPGARLPATRALAGSLSLSRSTVTEAYEQLRAEGYLSGRHGSGTYVASDLPGVTDAVATPATGSVTLSAWGERMRTAGTRQEISGTQAGEFRFDFNPQRVAEDRFPWEEWEEAVIRSLTGGRRRLLAYPPAAGDPALRTAIARHVGTFRAVSCDPDQVIVVSGSQQGFTLLSHLLLEAGDAVAMEDPGYPAARIAYEARGARIVTAPVDDEGMQTDTLRGQAVRLIHVTPSHQYPTGVTMTLGRRLTLLERAREGGSLIIEDDYDSEFRYEGRPVESLQGLDSNGLVIYAGTFSKSILAGLRLGFLIVPPPLVEPVTAAKSLWDSGTPMLEQAALAEFMQTGAFERHIRRMRRLYASRRDALAAALEAAFGTAASIGARHSGLNVPVTFDVGLGEEEIIARAARAGIGLRGTSRCYTVPPVRPTLLFGFGGLTEEEIGQGIQLLAGALSP